MDLNVLFHLSPEKMMIVHKEKEFYFQEDLSHINLKKFQTDLKLKMSANKHLLDLLALYPNFNHMDSLKEMLMKTHKEFIIRMQTLMI